MARPSECSIYRGFEFSSDFNERVLVKVQGNAKTVRVTGSSSYRDSSYRDYSYCITIIVIIFGTFYAF